MIPKITPLLLCIALLAGCKTTEDRIQDLYSSVDDEGRLNLQVFDAGQLVHEGMSGIVDAEVLTLSQMGRSVHASALIIEGNEVALCRADAARLLGHIALYYPVPPVAERLDTTKGVAKEALECVTQIADASRYFRIENQLIPALDNPDRAVVEKAREDLVKLVGEDLGSTADAWVAWWDANSARITGEAIERSAPLLERLAEMRYRRLSDARAVLGFIATSLALQDIAELRQPMQDVVLRTSRQVIVYGLLKGLQDKDKSVRMDAALAAGQVLDVAFGPALLEALVRERDPDARIHIIQTLEAYPARSTAQALLVSLQDPDPQIALNAREVLARQVGQDFGEDDAAWRIWWEREGKSRWP